MKGRYKSFVRYLVGVLISAAALVWLAQIYDVNDLIEPFGSADYRLILLAIAVSVVDYLFRSIRWKLLFLDSKPKRISSVFRALMQGYLFNMLLPARAGDVLRVHRLGKDEGISRGTVLGTVVVERVGDMVVLIALLIAVFSLYPNTPEWFKYVAGTMMLGTTVVVVLLASMHFYEQPLKSFLYVLMNRFLSENACLKIESIGGLFIESLTSLFKIQSIVSFLAITFLLWFFAVLVAFCVAGSLGLWLSMGDLLFVMMVIVVGTMIPSSPGHIGVYEVFGLAGLEMIGVTGGDALSFIVILHAVTILVPGVIGALCMFKWTKTSLAVSPSGVEKQ